MRATPSLLQLGRSGGSIEYEAAGIGDGEHRVARRRKIFEPTMLRSEAAETRVHLINVSETGALVHMSDPPERGSAVLIDLGHTSVDAELVWTKGSWLGLRFRTRLFKTTIDRLLRA